MRLPLDHLPARLVTGAYILHSGLDKLGADEQTAAQMHGFASGTYPMLRKVPPARFIRLLGAWETALGAALLLPVVPSALAGAGLVTFAGALLGMYAKTPGLRKQGSIWPTEQGITLSKDSWMLGMGLSLLVGDLLEARTRRSRAHRPRTRRS